MNIVANFYYYIFAQKLVPTCSDYSPDAGTTFIFFEQKMVLYKAVKAASVFGLCDWL